LHGPAVPIPEGPSPVAASPPGVIVTSGEVTAMFQGTQDSRDHGWSIRSVFVADPDGPRRGGQTIPLLLRVSAAGPGARVERAEGGDEEAGHLCPRVHGPAGAGPDD